MELLYVVLGLLVLYLFMDKCGCKRVEGVSNDRSPENYNQVTGKRDPWWARVLSLVW